MLWIEPCTVACIATIGGVIGGGLMAIANKYTNKFNVEKIEQYWNEDIMRLERWLVGLEGKISTISVVKPVVNIPGHRQGKGFKNTRHFKHGDQK